MHAPADGTPPNSRPTAFRSLPDGAAAPVTAASVTAASVTAAPTSAAPTSAAPTSAAPTAAAPTAAAPVPAELSAAGAVPSARQVAAGLLRHLQQVAPLTLWALARRDADDCVLEAVQGAGPVGEPGSADGEPSAGALAAGARFPWSATVCARMVRGGPRVVPDLARVPEYASAPLARRLPIGAYVAAPVRDRTGNVLGSLFGLDPVAQDNALARVAPLVEVFAEVLGAALDSDAALRRERERADEAERRAVTDGLTGLGNRLAWDEALSSEQSRATRRELWTGLISVDLDELKRINDRDGHAAGDQLLVVAADALRSVVRREDVLARVGGDEFAALAGDCDESRLDRLLTRLRVVLDSAGVRASVGAVSVPPGTELIDAWRLADAQMYAEKRGIAHRQLDLHLPEDSLGVS